MKSLKPSLNQLLLKFTTLKLPKTKFQQALSNQQRCPQLLKETQKKVTSKPADQKAVTNSPLKASDPNTANAEEEKEEKVRM